MRRFTSFVNRVSAMLALTILLGACTQGNGSQSATPTNTAPPQPTNTPTALPEPTSIPAPTPSSNGGVITGTAAVESVEILMLESFPVQVRVIARGSHPDPCTKTKEITQKRDGNTFDVTITTARARDELCIQVISPFEETISLDVAGLKAGTYTVTVNGVSDEFTLTTDNVFP